MKDLPLELVELILSNITDARTKLNCRLVNRLWYDFFNPFKIYKKGKHIETIIFSDLNVISYYPCGILKSELRLKKLGKAIYNEYNSMGMLIETITLVPPYRIRKKNISMNLEMNVNYDINREKETKRQIYNNMGCIVC